MNYNNINNLYNQPTKVILNKNNHNMSNSCKSNNNQNNNFNNNNLSKSNQNYNMNNMNYQNNANYQNNNNNNFNNNANYQNNNVNNNYNNNANYQNNNVNNNYNNNANYQNNNNNFNNNANYQNNNVNNNNYYCNIQNNNMRNGCQNNYINNMNCQNNANYQNNNNNTITDKELYSMMFEDYKKLYPNDTNPLYDNTIKNMMYDYMLIESIIKDLEKNNPENCFKLMDLSKYYQWKQAPLNCKLNFKIIVYKSMVENLLNRALMNYPNNKTLLRIQNTYNAQKDQKLYYSMKYGFDGTYDLYTQLLNYSLLYSFLNLLCKGQFIKNLLNLEQNLINNEDVDLAALLLANKDLNNRAELIRGTTIGKKFYEIIKKIQELTGFFTAVDIKTTISSSSIEQRKNIYNQQQMYRQNYNYNIQQNMNNNYNQNFNNLQRFANMPQYQISVNTRLDDEALKCLNFAIADMYLYEQEAYRERKPLIQKFHEKCIDLFNKIIKRDSGKNINNNQITLIINKMTHMRNDHNDDDNTFRYNHVVNEEMIKIFMLLNLLGNSSDEVMKSKIIAKLTDGKNDVGTNINNRIDFVRLIDHLSTETQNIVLNFVYKIRELSYKNN